MAPPVSILHIVTRLDRGGSADNVLISAIGQRKLGYGVSLAFGPGEGKSSPLLERARAEGVELVGLPQLVRPLRPLADLRALVKLRRLIARGGFQIVHTHSSKAGALGRLAARLGRAPITLHTPHGHVFYGYFPSPLSWLFLRAERLLAPLADRIVALTEGEKEEHLARGVGRREQFAVVPSGVELGGIRAVSDPERKTLRRSLSLLGEVLLVGSAGRFEPVKGHRVLVEAAARVAAEEPRALIVLFGEGPLRGELEKLARRLGVGEKVRFMGWREDLPRLLPALDLFCLPSLNEGMGRAAVEAMAAGLPVVASRAGGLPSVVEEGLTGLLVPPGDSEALADALLSLLADPSRRRQMGEAAQRRSRAFGAEEMVAALDALYRELLEEKGVVRGEVLV